ncbi:MAG: methylated-DNA--[protein]-cysteine S-methyltransferase [Treponema sp.]
MIYEAPYKSPLGTMILESDGTALTELNFAGQKWYAPKPDARLEPDLTVFKETARWLDAYFGGAESDFTVPLALSGTPFQTEVWDILLTIPYGKTATYKEIAETLARRRGIKRMAAQAVGGAVGRNPVSIIVPCHRVIGTDGSLTGYASGLDKKEFLLRLEKIL